MAIVSDALPDPVTVQLLVSSSDSPVVERAIDVSLLSGHWLVTLVVIVALAGAFVLRYPNRGRHWISLALVIALAFAIGNRVPLAASDIAIGPLDALPPTLQFDQVVAGTSGLPKTAKIANHGKASVRVMDVVVPSPFAQQNDCSVLAPDGSCSVSVWLAANADDACQPLPLPTVLTLTPARLVAGASGAKVLVSGTGFQRGAVVRMNATSVQPESIDDGAIFFALPAAFAKSSQSIAIRVRNPDGGVSNATVLMVDAANIQPTAVITTPLGGKAFKSGEVINVVAGATDPDGSVVRVELFDGQTPLFQSDGAAFIWNWSNAAPGVHKLTVVATDNDGAKGTSSPVDISVAEPEALSIELTGPIVGAAYTEPAAISMSAQLRGVTAPVESVSFLVNGSALGSVVGTPYHWPWQNVQAGSYSVEAVAIDTNGSTARSRPVVVTVSANSAAPALIITSHADGQVIDAESITLEGTTRHVKAVSFPGDCRIVEYSSPTFVVRDIPVTHGDNEITVTGVADDGTRVERTIVVHNVRPTLLVDAPGDGAATSLPYVEVRGRFLAPEGSVVKVLRSDIAAEFWAPPAGMGFQTPVPLKGGKNSFVAILTTPQGKVVTKAFAVTRDDIKVDVAITSPQDLQVVEANEIDVAGTYTAPPGATVSINGDFALLGDHTFASHQRLATGTNYIIATLNAPGGGLVQTRVRVENAFPRAGPINTPPAGSSVPVGPTLVEGLVLARDRSIITINGSPAELVDRRLYYTSGNLNDFYYWRIRSTTDVLEGDNSITLKVVSPSGNSDTAQIHVSGNLGSGLPVVAISSPADGSFISAGQSITVTASSAENRIMQLELLEDGKRVTGVDVDAISVTRTLDFSGKPPGTYRLSARAIDQRGASSTSAPITVKRPWIPAVEIVAPANQAHFIKGQPIHVKVNASVTDGTIRKVVVTDNRGTLRADLPPPYEFDWIDAGIGPHPLSAIITSDAGIVVTSAGVTINVDPPLNLRPVVSLETPHDGDTYVLHAPINFYALATDPDGTIAKLEFFDGDKVLSPVGGPPYLYPWTQATLGSHSVTARATDDKGATTASSPVSINVIPDGNLLPKARVTAPITGELFSFDEPIRFAVEASDDDGSIARVDFYDESKLIGSASSAPYELRLENATAGLHALSAVAVDAKGGSTTSAPVKVTVNPEPQLNFDPNPDGTSVDQDFITITGTVVAPPNAGISVNGELAVYDRSGHFQVTNVPLKPGVNELTVTLATDDGKVLTKRMVVTSTGRSPYLVTATPNQGFTQLVATITFNERIDTGVDHVEFDLDGNGTIDATRLVENGTAKLAVTVSTAGTRVVRAFAKDAAGALLYESSQMLVVFDEASQEALLREVWSNLNSALLAGNVEKALVSLNAAAQRKYEPVFNGLLPYFAEIIASYSNMQSVEVTPRMGEFAINRVIGGEEKLFLLYLLQNEFGVWKMDSM